MGDELLLLKNGCISLRYIIEEDIEDYIRWTTAETEWSHWDSPWESFADDELVRKQLEHLNENPKKCRKLEIVIDEVFHIGWVSAYNIDNLDETDDYYGKLAVGIDIIPRGEREKGYGEKALTLFMAYLFSNEDTDEICTQTWSGNIPMIRLAEKIGFSEVRRRKGVRAARGKMYDALTFMISRDSFFKRYSDIFDA